MNIKNRIKKIEAGNAQKFDDWLSNLSDEELQKIVGERRKDNGFSDWLKTLTDEEVEILRYGKTGAATIREKFNEYKKPN